MTSNVYKPQLKRNYKYHLFSVKCYRCGKRYIKSSNVQIYCGSMKKKKGCSYLNYLDQSRENKKRWRKNHPILYKKQNKLQYFKNRETYKEYSKWYYTKYNMI